VAELTICANETPSKVSPSPRPNAALADDPALRQAIELLFFAYRDFTGDADVLLARWGFGRAHHRVIYFVGRKPGITVGELLAILRITKQSLARVLRQLMQEGFVVQHTDPGDRRRRRLHLTAEAEALERTVTEHQATRLAAAWNRAGATAAEGFRAVLRAMVDADKDAG
jgi:DNA-binding MarR family transcriptional regulator